MTTRILFVGEAVTLAHVARPLVLANALDPARYEVIFACANQYRIWLTGSDHVRHLPLKSLSPERFVAALAAGRPVYDQGTLEGYVEEDRRILREIRPDLVVGDFRLSLAVSAPLEGVRYFNLTNAHWSPYAKLARYPFPEHPLSKRVGLPVAETLFRCVRPLIFRMHALPLNRVRKAHGLSPFADLREAYTWGDRTLYADVPELVPTADPPASHRYLGPVLWSPPAPLPSWWGSIPNDRPLVYVTMGSSGQVSALPALVSALAALPVYAMVATAGRVTMTGLPSNVYAAKYLPGMVAAGRSALVVCNGGSATVYQALSQGVPVLGIASNMDQHLTMGAVQTANAGVLVRAEQATENRVSDAVALTLNAPQFGQGAKQVAVWCSKTDAIANFLAAISDR